MATLIIAGENPWRQALNDNPAHVTEKLHQQKLLHNPQKPEVQPWYHQSFAKS